MIENLGIPAKYRSSLISRIKKEGSSTEDLSPYILDLGSIIFKVARQFGFCFGVEKAIALAYQALEENPDKRIFLLSEMIHNQQVNSDLKSRGVEFVLGPAGEELVPLESLTGDDIVIVPAFGTTVELLNKFGEMGIDLKTYDATCPFVQRVWKRSRELAEAGFTVVIHGKDTHEETQAIFSHASACGPAVIVKDVNAAEKLSGFIVKSPGNDDDFKHCFKDLASKGFNIETNLKRIGVVNQTTMLASETEEICSIIKKALAEAAEMEETDFAETRETRCYATSINQHAVRRLIESGGDLAVVVGGYNSSNTAHLAKLCSEAVQTFHIKDAEELLDRDTIRHLDLASREILTSRNWLPESSKPVRCLVTAGASCPDSLVESVIRRIASFCCTDGSLPLIEGLQKA